MGGRGARNTRIALETPTPPDLPSVSLERATGPPRVPRAPVDIAHRTPGPRRRVTRNVS
ncbi:hypothetical protein MUK42_19381 [Musa troglodytarum]|uniref:Uncharacterized protein n=1 Tax=Musa troglodytarum TaxID=320322 RepID=A0A9E7G966_9LILI|nr:hypothetical protein MUK42_19381 [Musa troglodytarum]